MHETVGERPHIYAVVAILVLALSGIFFTFRDKAAEDVVPGEVIEVLSEGRTTLDLGSETREIAEQKLLVEIDSTEGAKTLEVFNDFMPVDTGDKVFIGTSAVDEAQYSVIDISRTKEIFALAIFFVVLVLLTSGRKGLYSLVGLLWSFAVIFSFLVPQILKGSNPILIGIAGAAAILGPTLYLSYGWNRKSLAAFLGIIAALVFTGLLANFSVAAARFSGLSEASQYLDMEAGSSINLIGLMIAGIIIAAVGVLDDVAAVQSSTVFALASVDPNLRGLRLFKKAMSVGKDHISAVVNTLVLAYVGAALPLILLFSLRDIPASYFVSIEIVAEEIIRTLAASAGLLLAVPLSTAIAAMMAGTSQKKVGAVG